MIWKLLIIFLNVFIYSSNAAVLLWSDQELRINPLQPFTIQEFSTLAEDLEKPDIQIFQSPTQLSPLLKEILIGYYTAYTPNGYLESDNITYLLGDSELDVIKIKELTSDLKSNNVLFALNIPDSERFKREAKNISETEKPEKLSVIDEPVIYVGEKSLNDTNKLFALLYSSKPLLLKRPDSEDLHLGSTHQDMIVLDTRLNVKVKAIEGPLISLRFSFTWTGSGYWSMTNVKIDDIDSHRDHSLMTEEDVSAAARFSYHCNGKTVFTDQNNTVELHIYDLQVQPDSRNRKFDDANDCVPFTTIPIWSGIFVTSILGIGLIVALTAIMDIKTMDKFDNQKTKNLTVTVSE